MNFSESNKGLGDVLASSSNLVLQSQQDVVQLFHFNYYIITSTIIMWLCFLQMKGPAVLLQLKSTWEFGKVSKIITEFRFLLNYIITEEIVWGSTG